jgi:MFS family permease
MTSLESQRRWVLVALFGTLFCTLGSIVNTIPIFITPLMKHYGWTHTQASAVPMAYSLTMGLGAPLVGWLLDRVEARIVMARSAGAGIRLFPAGSSHSFRRFYCPSPDWRGRRRLSIVPCRGGGQLFGDRRGFAIGVTIAGGLMGGVIMLPVIDHLLDHRSDRHFTLATMVLVVPTTLILAFIRTRPAGAVATSPARQLDSLPGLELSPALRTRQFWILAAVQLLATIGMFGTFFYMVPFLIQSGYASSSAALAMSFINAAAGVGLLIMGALCDRFGGRRVLPLIAIQLGASSRCRWRAGCHGWAFYLELSCCRHGGRFRDHRSGGAGGAVRAQALRYIVRPAGDGVGAVMAIGPMVVGVVLMTNSHITASNGLRSVLWRRSAFALSPIAGIETAHPSPQRVASLRYSGAKTDWSARR